MVIAYNLTSPMCSKNEVLLSVLVDIAQALSEISCDVEVMALEVKDVILDDERGMLREEPIFRLRDILVGFKNDVSVAAMLIPQTHYPFEVPWIGEKRKKLRLNYVSGEDPRGFYLGYKDDHQLQKIQDAIKEKYSQKLLKKVSPDERKFVLCVRGQGQHFRAVVLRQDAPVRKGPRSVTVYNVDTGDTACVSADDIYCVPEDLAFIPCRVIKCCLVLDDHLLKDKFDEQLQFKFKDVLSRSELTVDILDDLGSNPCCFSAVVWVYNEDFGSSDLNLNRLMKTALHKKINGTRALIGSKSPGSIQNDSITSPVCNIDEPNAFRVAESIEKVVGWLEGRKEPKLKPPKPICPIFEPSFDLLSPTSEPSPTPTDPLKSKLHGDDVHTPPQTEDKPHAKLSPFVPEFVPRPVSMCLPAVKYAPKSLPTTSAHVENHSNGKGICSSISPSAPEFVPKSASTNHGYDKGVRSSISPSAPEFIPKSALMHPRSPFGPGIAPNSILPGFLDSEA